MSLDWDDNEENQPKTEKKTIIRTRPVMTITLKLPIPFINKYFDSMSNETPMMYTPKENHIHDTITSQQELNTTKCKVQNQDLLEELD